MMFEQLFNETSMSEPEADDRRLQILDATFRVLMDKGWASGSMRDVARQAGITPGLIYHYFGSKHGLLLAALEQYNLVPHLVTFLASRADRPAAEVLPELVRRAGDLFEERRGMLPVVVREAQVDPELHQRWLELMAEGQGALERYLVSRIEAGELRPHNVAASARMMMSTVMMGRLVGWFDQVGDDLADLLLDGIRERTG